MIDIETLFILGAGASVPYGFPTAEGLGGEICKNFPDNFRKVWEVFAEDEKLGNDEIKQINKEVNKFIKHFEKSRPLSIDLYLARNGSFAEYGKKAIVLQILEAEKNSKFNDYVQSIEQDWHSHLFKIMTKELIEPNSYKSFGKNKVSVITFNYDRSLEHFLYESLLHSFQSAPSEEVIIEELNKIPIIHVYGKIAPLPWQDGIGSIAYGCEYQYRHINGAKNNIRVVHERPDKDIETIGQLISKAKRIFFLGFGYGKENLEVLKIPELLIDDKEVFGTAVGFLKNEIERLQRLLNKSRFPEIEDTNCLRLLRKYL